MIGAPDLIYANGLESGGFTGWYNTPGANLTVSTASKIAGTYGMQAAASSSTTSIYVTDKRPSAETQYRARFYLKTNNLFLKETTPLYNAEYDLDNIVEIKQSGFVRNQDSPPNGRVEVFQCDLNLIDLC